MPIAKHNHNSLTTTTHSVLLLFMFMMMMVMPCTPTSYYTLAYQFHTQLFTDDDIASWAVAGSPTPTSPLYTTCSSSRIVGGYLKLTGSSSQSSTPSSISKTWSNLPPHFSATISMSLYKIDSWSDQSIFIMVDGTPIDIYTFDSSTGTTDICGQPSPYLNTYNPQYNQYIINYRQTINHTSPTLTIQMVSNLNGWTGSWGFRDFTILLSRCDMSCLTCTEQTQCTTCDTTNNLLLVGQFCQCSTTGYMKLMQTQCAVSSCVTCVLICPSGYYIQSSTACASCDTPCATCTGVGTLYPVCATCNPIRYIMSGNCTVCYGTCNSCTSLLYNACTSCLSPTFLNPDGQCLSTCPSLYYGQQYTLMCVGCVSPCLQCGSAVQCTTCISGYYLYVYDSVCYNGCPYSMYGYDGICISSCVLSTYPDTTNSTNYICMDCPVYCDTCESSTVCTACTYLTYYNPDDQLCYSTCPISYYSDASTYTCSDCSSQCLTCSGPTSGDCLSCPPATYLVYSSCYSTCPSHTYSSTCLLCDSGCLECASSASVCTSCYLPMLLHVNSSTCVQECQQGDVVDHVNRECMTCAQGYVGTFGVCVQCAQGCMTCGGVCYWECVSCVDVSVSVGGGYGYSPFITYTYTQNEQSVQQKYGYGVGIQFVQDASMCVYEGMPIVYMPQLQNTDTKVHTTIFYCIIINVFLCLILQLTYVNKTNLLPTLQLMQVLSYMYMLNVPLSESNQNILLTLFWAHPTSWFLYLPKVNSFVGLDYDNMISGKFYLIGKTGVYFYDTFYIHFFMFLLGIVYLLFRASKMYKIGAYVFKKISPYIVSYPFRLCCMQLVLSALLCVVYIQSIQQSVIKISVSLIVLDLLLIGASLFWKVRTQKQLKYSHYALFYFNQFKANQSILQSLVYFIGRIPFILTLLLFVQNPVTQSLCWFGYSLLLLAVDSVLNYRRKVYRYLSIFSHLCICLSGALLVLMCLQLKVQIWLDFWILLSFGILLICTLMQIFSNYLFWMSLWDFMIAKYLKYSRS